MYNALQEIQNLKTLVQIGIRDYSGSELEIIHNSNDRIITYFDKDIKCRLYEGQTWKQIIDEIVSRLPQKVHISFDIDGIDPKLCPNAGTPVHGCFEIEKLFYLFSKLLQYVRELI